MQVRGYTAWWQKHACANNFPKVALDSTVAGIEAAISNCKSSALTTMPPSHPAKVINWEKLVLQANMLKNLINDKPMY